MSAYQQLQIYRCRIAGHVSLIRWSEGRGVRVYRHKKMSVAIQLHSRLHQCWLCSSYASLSFPDVVRHIGSIHSHHPNFHVTCCLDGCVAQFRSFAAYKSHLYRTHSNIIRLQQFPPNFHNQLESFVDEGMYFIVLQ